MNAQIAILQPYAELPLRAAIRYTIKWQVFGLLLLVAHVVLTKLNFGFTLVSMLVLAGLYYKAPLAGLLGYFQLLIFQNWFIALFSTDMQIMSFKVLQGTNFAAICVMAGVAAARLAMPLWKNERDIHQIMRVMLF